MDVEPTLQDVLDAAVLYGVPRKKAEQFFYHYDSVDWVTGSGQKIKRWKSKLVEWKLNKYRFDKSDMNPVTFTKTCCVCGKEAAFVVSGKGYCSREHRIQKLGW